MPLPGSNHRSATKTQRSATKSGMGVRVIRARALGMCFGVRQALATAARVSEPDRVSIHGELVHNPMVLHQLEARGFHLHDEGEQRPVPPSPVVMITAHGVSDAERQRLKQAGKTLIDTTCPLVKRVHRAATELQHAGYFVLVIGRRGHVEVQGLVGDLQAYDIVETIADVRTYRTRRIGIVCQTTSVERDVEDIAAEVRRRNPDAEIRCVDTICQPTRDRQSALTDLLSRVDAMVIVGGHNSNNTRRLVARSRAEGRPAYHVERASELEPHWFAGFATVGLAAGTSTLDTTVDEVHEALARMLNPV